MELSGVSLGVICLVKKLAYTFSGLSSGKWSNVKLGWLIAGLSTLLVSLQIAAQSRRGTDFSAFVQTSVLCIYATYRHARNYHRPKGKLHSCWALSLAKLAGFLQNNDK